MSAKIQRYDAHDEYILASDCGRYVLHSDHLAAVAALVERNKRLECGVALIAKERERQVSQEGWTIEHDDDHGYGEMADAAACYAMTSRTPYVHATIPGSARSPDQIARIPFKWPWNAEWWRPCPDDRIKELVKAGALIAAEIDRLQRAALAGEKEARS